MIGNEFRLGIFVSINGSEIKVDEDFMEVLYAVRNYNDYTPIPLTEEWKIKLEKAPIFMDKLGFVIFKNGYQYAFTWDEYPYLHQLQNLYFALTGEELVCV